MTGEHVRDHLPPDAECQAAGGALSPAGSDAAFTPIPPAFGSHFFVLSSKIYPFVLPPESRIEELSNFITKDNLQLIRQRTESKCSRHLLFRTKVRTQRTQCLPGRWLGVKCRLSFPPWLDTQHCQFPPFNTCAMPAEFLLLQVITELGGNNQNLCLLISGR